VVEDKRGCAQQGIDRGHSVQREGPECLIVAAISLALGIEDTLPVLLLKLGLGVNVHQNLDVATLLAHLGHPDALPGEDGADEAADDRGGGAPLADHLTGLERVLGAPLGVPEGGLALVDTAAVHLGTSG